MGRGRKKTKTKTSSNHTKLLFLIPLLIITVAAGVIVIQPKPVTQSASTQSQLGGVNCEINLLTIPYSSGMPVSRTDLPNAPYLLNGTEVDVLQAIVNIIANGEYVDWSTLSISVNVYVNEQLFTSYNLPNEILSPTAGGYSDVRTIMIQLTDELVGPPISTDANGVDTFKLHIKVEASGSIIDTKEHVLTDDVLLQNIWEFQSTPDGTFDLSTPDVTTPDFLKTPGASLTLALHDKISLLWIATDDNPTTFEISLYIPEHGESIVKSGEWTDSSPIDFDFDGIESGEYTISCKVYDADHNSMTNSVAITVSESEATEETTPSPGALPPRETEPVIPGIDWDKFVNSPWGSGTTVSISVSVALLITGAAAVIYVWVWRRE